ncbi:MAG: 50S ribosomal protein L15 [Burkholderiales bacterium]|nr:50S ribosomal protein L15 [Anaerolineae bacterium]
MKLHELKPAPGSKKKRTRVGRGIAAGQGKTAGRGTKGQGARSGGGKGPYFEGGQLPMVRRLPFKRGFNNIFRIDYQEVNVGELNDAFEAGATVTAEALRERNLIRDVAKPYVVLGTGEISKKLTINAHRFTKSAEQKITAAGGSVNKVELLVKGAFATVKKLTKEQLVKLQSQKQG